MGREKEPCKDRGEVLPTESAAAKALGQDRMGNIKQSKEAGVAGARVSSDPYFTPALRSNNCAPPVPEADAREEPSSPAAAQREGSRQCLGVQDSKRAPWSFALQPCLQILLTLSQAALGNPAITSLYYREQQFLKEEDASTAS